MAEDRNSHYIHIKGFKIFFTGNKKKIRMENTFADIVSNVFVLKKL